MADRIQTALICLTLDHGGAEHHILKLARAMRGSRAHPIVVPLDRSARNNLRPQFEADGIPVLFPPYERNNVCVVPWLARFLHSGRVDVAHSFLWRSDVTLAMAASVTGFRRAICSERGDRLADLYWSPRWLPRRMLDKAFTFRTARTLVSNSPAGVEAAVRAGCPRWKTLVIHNWVDLALVESHRAAASDVRRRYGLGNRFVIGFVGRLVLEKGAVDFVRSAKAIAARVPRDRVAFMMVGDGPLRSQLENEVRESGLDDRFVFTGAVDTAMSLIHAMDVGMTCSLSESLPNVLLEFMACAKPVVATNVGGIGDVIEDGFNGRLIPSASVDTLVDACVALAQRPELARAMGCAGRRTVEEKYSMADGVRAYIRLYEQTAEQR